MAGASSRTIAVALRTQVGIRERVRTSTIWPELLAVDPVGSPMTLALRRWRPGGSR
jgi:hypothetical protein